ncbi:hypothetical protein F7R28_13735 [Polaromonas sp. Pch-P]|nr:RHS repeat protein [Polaromonas sp. Pch-P]QGJ19349.1 hypothetical protein F7R28_13735 [Polaromonas sp. Pch-P]
MKTTNDSTVRGRNGLFNTPFVAGLCSLAILSFAAPVFAQSMTWQYGYDAMGRPTTVLDPNGLATYIYYDSLGRPIQTQQPANTGTSNPTVTGFSYNANDSLTQVTDPRNLNTNYTPNGLGDVTTQTSPDTGASQYTYDANGNVQTKTDARGKLTQYTYDNLDRSSVSSTRQAQTPSLNTMVVARPRLPRLASSPRSPTPVAKLFTPTTALAAKQPRFRPQVPRLSRSATPGAIAALRWTN